MSTATAPRAYTRWSRERVIDTLCDLAEQLGHTPSFREAVAARLSGMVAAAYRLFGSWPAACEAAGLQNAHDQWREQLQADAEANLEQRRADAIHTLQLWAEGLGRTPAASMAKRAGAPIFLSTVEELFGSWNAGIDAAGLPPNPLGRPARIDREAMIRLLQETAADLGRTPTGDEVGISASTVARAFGTWNKALLAAGLTPVQVREHTRESVIVLLQGWAFELGRVPSSREADSHGALVSRSTVKKLFGTWNAGLEAAGLLYGKPVSA